MSGLVQVHGRPSFCSTHPASHILALPDTSTLRELPDRPQPVPRASKDGLPSEQLAKIVVSILAYLHCRLLLSPALVGKLCPPSQPITTLSVCLPWRRMTSGSQSSSNQLLGINRRIQPSLMLALLLLVGLIARSLAEVAPGANVSLAQDTSARRYLERRNFGNRLPTSSNSSRLSLIQLGQRNDNLTDRYEAANSSGQLQLLDQPMRRADQEASKLLGHVKRLDLFPGGRLIRTPPLSSTTTTVLDSWHKLLLPRRAYNQSLLEPHNSSSADEHWASQRPDLVQTGLVTIQDEPDQLVVGNLSESRDYQVVHLDQNEDTQQVYSGANYLAEDQQQRATNGTTEYGEPKMEWMEASTDIEQVIHKDNADGDKAAAGRQSSQAAGSGEQAAAGERLRNHELSSSWQREKSGEEQNEAERKKEAQKEEKMQLDLGHNKHGWKNVYHKEEYAQHQKYHDLYRDKNWDQNRERTEGSDQSNKGSKYNELLSKQFYDKDKHGTKYDYTRGSGWKRIEDEAAESGNQSGAEHQSREPSASYMKEVGVAAPSNGEEQPDEGVIEQMRNKLDRLSSGSEPDGGQYSRAAKEGEDDEGAGSHRSINEILKSARQVERGSRRSNLRATKASPPNQHYIAHEAEGSSQHQSTSEDEAEPDEEHDVTGKPATEKSRKNAQLRLKLELNLGKSDNQRSQQPDSRRNISDESSIWTGKDNQQSGWLAPGKPSNGGWQPAKSFGLEPIRSQPPVRALKGRQFIVEKQASEKSKTKQGQRKSAKDKPRPKPIAGEGPTSDQLAKVLPARPIYVKNLQMNGSVVLGKQTGPGPESSTNGKGEEALQVAPNSGEMANDFSIESSLANALGDHDDSLQQANSLGARFQDNQAIKEFEPANNNEYMLLFDDSNSAAASDSFNQRVPNYRKPTAQIHQAAHEPHVIFETSASNIDQQRRPLFQTDADETSNSLMLPDGFSPQYQKLEPANVRQPPRLIGQDYRLANLLRLAPFIGSHLTASPGSSLAATMVVPSVQQAFGRLLRLPRMFSASSSTHQSQLSEDQQQNRYWPTRQALGQNQEYPGHITGSMNEQYRPTASQHQQAEESQLDITRWPQPINFGRPQSMETPLMDNTGFGLLSLRPQLNLQQGLSRPLEIGDLMEATTRTFTRVMNPNLIDQSDHFRPQPYASSMKYSHNQLPRKLISQPESLASKDKSRINPAELKRLLKKNDNKKKSSTPERDNLGVLNQLGTQWKKPLRFESNYTSMPFLPSVVAPFKWSVGGQQSLTSSQQARARPSSPSSALRKDLARGRDTAEVLHNPSASMISNQAVVGPYRSSVANSAMRAKSHDKRESTRLAMANRIQTDSPKKMNATLSLNRSRSTKAPNFGQRVIESFKSKLGSVGFASQARQNNHQIRPRISS